MNTSKQTPTDRKIMKRVARKLRLYPIARTVVEAGRAQRKELEEKLHERNEKIRTLQERINDLQKQLSGDF